MTARPGTLADLGVDEPDTAWAPPCERPLDRREVFDRDHPDAPSNPRGER